jgi:signal transduction histidine kinase
MTRPKILIVEDEWIIGSNIQEALVALGYGVTSIAQTGDAALEKARRESPDLILMDVKLQGEMDGIETAGKIQSFLNVPVIYMTSFTDEKTIERAKKTQPFGYIVKPFENGELRTAIEMALYKHRIETELKEKSRLLTELNATLENRVHEEIEKGRQKELMLVQQSKLAAMGEMMNAIAHQWRQPLNITGLLIQDVEEAHGFGELDITYIRKFVKDAMTQLNYMSKTITDFTDFFKPTKEKIDFDVKTAIEDMITLLHAQLENARIVVDVVSPDRMKGEPPVVVPGFTDEFKQVMVNLINNARDAILQHRQSGNGRSQEGRIRIEVDRSNSGALITVADTGGGIPQDILDRIFEPYFTSKIDGTGIGLYMSKVIIENHMGGKLHAKNNEKGAVFVIELKGRNSHSDPPATQINPMKINPIEG